MFMDYSKIFFRKKWYKKKKHDFPFKCIFNSSYKNIMLVNNCNTDSDYRYIF